VAWAVAMSSSARTIVVVVAMLWLESAVIPLCKKYMSNVMSTLCLLVQLSVMHFVRVRAIFPGQHEISVEMKRRSAFIVIIENT